MTCLSIIQTDVSLVVISHRCLPLRATIIKIFDIMPLATNNSNDTRKRWFRQNIRKDIIIWTVDLFFMWIQSKLFRSNDTICQTLVRLATHSRDVVTCISRVSWGHFSSNMVISNPSLSSFYLIPYNTFTGCGNILFLFWDSRDIARH